MIIILNVNLFTGKIRESRKTKSMSQYFYFLFKSHFITPTCQQNLRKQNLLNEEKNIKECEENKIRLHQKNSNNDKVIKFIYIFNI